MISDGGKDAEGQKPLWPRSTAVRQFQLHPLTSPSIIRTTSHVGREGSYTVGVLVPGSLSSSLSSHLLVVWLEQVMSSVCASVSSVAQWG